MNDVEVPSVEILRLQPGDVIVATVRLSMDAQYVADVSALLRDRFPDHEVLVVVEGLKLGVCREAT